MVIGPAAPRLADDLPRLDVGSPHSRVRRIAHPVDPMRRFREAAPFAPPDGDAGQPLRDAGALLEWAYGFRAHPTQHGRVTRRSPSAGALYPTEVMVLLHVGGRWRVLYYDCRLHAFFVVEAARASALAESFGIETGDVVVLLTSVLWRSAQRYGARCYLYCLLDAGHVAANLAWAARGFGHDVVPVGAPTAVDLERTLALRADEALVLALRIGSGPAAGRVEPPPCHVQVDAPGPGVLEPPPVSPLLRRTAAFHGRTLGSPRPLPTLDWLPYDGARGDLATVADRRHSAAAFAPGAASAAHHAALVDHAREILTRRSLAGAPRLAAHVVSARVQGNAPGTRALWPGRDAGTLDGDSAERTSAALQDACQGQRVAGQAACAIALAAPRGDLERSGHAGFRRVALEAGAVSAELYRHAAAIGIGTTAIGGFAALRVARLLGAADVWPLTVQVFGVEAAGAAKADAAVVAAGRSDARRAA